MMIFGVASHIANMAKFRPMLRTTPSNQAVINEMGEVLVATGGAFVITSIIRSTADNLNPAKKKR